jgi:hypothetical protein
VAKLVPIWDASTWPLVKKVNRKQDPVILGSSVSWSHDAGRLIFLGATEGDPQQKRIANNTLQIVVPIVSSERLAAIIRHCAKVDVQQQLLSRTDKAHISEFIDTVKQQPETKIPPVCAADLIAIAETLQKQP